MITASFIRNDNLWWVSCQDPSYSLKKPWVETVVSIFSENVKTNLHFRFQVLNCSGIVASMIRFSNQPSLRSLRPAPWVGNPMNGHCLPPVCFLCVYWNSARRVIVSRTHPSCHGACPCTHAMRQQDFKMSSPYRIYCCHCQQKTQAHMMQIPTSLLSLSSDFERRIFLSESFRARANWVSPALSLIARYTARYMHRSIRWH